MSRLDAQTTLRSTLLAAFVLGACGGNGTGPTRIATALAFQAQPQNAVAGVPLSPSVQVRAVDSTGSTVTTFTGTVTVAFGANPGGGALAGSTSVNAVSGIATFSSIAVDSTASGYTLTASSGALAGATSTSFNVIAGPSATTLLAGDHQPGLVSFAVNDRPALRVTNVHGTPMSGIAVTFAVGSGGGRSSKLAR